MVEILTKKVEIICEFHGARTLTHHFFNEQWLGSEICDLCRDDLHQREEEKKAKRKQELAFAAREAELRAAIGRAGIPPRFASKYFCDYVSRSQEQSHVLKVCQEYAENFNQNLRTGKSLVLAGSMGTGKTHLACAIANHIIMEARKTALYVRTSQAMRMIKSTYSSSSEISTEKAIERLVSPDLLILDEVGAQFGSQAEQNIFLEIIDGRYEQAKPTILLSNLTAAELKKFATPQAIDRLLEGGGRLLTFNWESARPSAMPIAAH